MKLELKIKGLVFDPDRHGNPRYYFRRKGQPKIRIHSPIGTDDFREEVRCAELGVPFSKVAKPVEVRRTIAARPGSLKWLSLEFLRRNKASWSDGYYNRAENILAEICSATGLSTSGASNGDLAYAKMQLKHVALLRDEKSEAPTMANRRVKLISAMFNWAIGAGLAVHNPADKCPKVKINSDGFHTWSMDEIQAYQRRHPVGSKADLALRIFIFTGLRKGDVSILGRQHLYDSNGETRIRLTPGKTKGSSGVLVDIPLLPPLAEALNALPEGQMTFLLTQGGAPYTANGLGNAMRDWCDQAGLPHCTAHGLRKAGAVIAAEAGATSDQLKAIFGWTTDAQAALYTRAASRKKLATQGAKLITLETRVRHSS